MNEERKLILKMVEQGKITADEAAALLEALGEDEGSSASEPEEDTWSRLEKQGEDFAHKVEVAADKFSRSLEDRIDTGVGETLSAVGRVLSRLPFVSGEESYEMTREYSGWFAQDAEEIPVAIETMNGRLLLEGWEQDHYKIIAVQRVRAKDRDSARAKTVDLGLEDGREGVQALEIRPPAASEIAFSFHLSLPKSRLFKLELLNTNGRTGVEHLWTSDVLVDATNGSISLRHVRGSNIHATTVNGSVQMFGVEGKKIVQRAGNGSAKLQIQAEKVEASTTNGSIRIAPTGIPAEGASLELAATNGSVRCFVPRDMDLGTKVDAVTGVGKAVVDLEQFEFSVQERRVGTNRVEGQSRDFDNLPRKLYIKAKAGSGTIQIAHGKEEGHGKT